MAIWGGRAKPVGSMTQFGLDLARRSDRTALAKVDSMRCEWVRRLDRGLKYDRQAAEIQEIVNDVTVLVDVTGNEGAMSLFNWPGAVPVKITSGYGARFEEGCWFISKRLLIDTLKHQIESGLVLPDDKVLREELLRFVRKQSGKYESDKTLGHDDTVIALALAAWPHHTLLDQRDTMSHNVMAPGHGRPKANTAKGW